MCTVSAFYYTPCNLTVEPAAWSFHCCGSSRPPSWCFLPSRTASCCCEWSRMRKNRCRWLRWIISPKPEYPFNTLSSAIHSYKEGMTYNLTLYEGTGFLLNLDPFKASPPHVVLPWTVTFCRGRKTLITFGKKKNKTARYKLSLTAIEVLLLTSVDRLAETTHKTWN